MSSDNSVTRKDHRSLGKIPTQKVQIKERNVKLSSNCQRLKRKIMNISHKKKHIYIYTPNSTFRQQVIFNPTHFREIKTNQKQPQEMCLRISKDFQAKEGKSCRGTPGISPRPNLSQGVLEQVSYQIALCTPASIHPLSHHLRVANVHSTHSAAFSSSSSYGVICCLIFKPLVSIKEKSGGEGCKSLHSTCWGSHSSPSLDPAAKAPVQPQVTVVGEQTRLPRPVNLSILSLSLVCFLSCWHALGSSTTSSVENSFLQDLRVVLKKWFGAKKKGTQLQLCAQPLCFSSTWKYELCKQFIFHIPPVAKSAKADKRGSCTFLHLNY